MFRRRIVVLTIFLFSHRAFSQEFLSLEDAIQLAVRNNYEINKQQYAIDAAKAQYMQASGALDFEVGAEASYSQKHTPVDKDDPNYTVQDLSSYGLIGTIYSDDATSRQTAGTVFVQKLFSFGLQSKLSYTMTRQKNTQDYLYSSNFPDEAKPEEEKARNYGTISLELSLPLFKSFSDSITAKELENARSYIEQMNEQLKHTVSKTVVEVSQKYYQYFLAYNNLLLLQNLQQKIESRNKNMDSLIRAGVRSRNDLLAMQVNALENQRNIDSANVQFQSARADLAQALSVRSVLPPPTKDSIPAVPITSADDAAQDEIDDDFTAKIVEKRSDLIALKKSMEAAEKKIRIAKINARPDATLALGIGATGTQYANDAGSFFVSGAKNIRGIDISTTVSVSAKLGNTAKKGAEEQAIAEYRSLASDYENALNTLEIQVKNAAEKLAVYKKSVQSADEVLALQKNLYENEQKLFNAGLITVDTLLSQDEKYISAENSYYQVLINYLLSVLEYKYYTATMFF